jgi:long-chain acyl-CoA synthetase
LTAFAVHNTEGPEGEEGSVSIASVADIIRVHAKERAGAPALKFEGRTITFAELDERSNRLANALADLGVGRGDRVAFLDKNTPEFFEVAFAVAKLGAVMVAVNWRLTGSEITQIVNDARAAAMFVGAEFVAQVADIQPQLETVSTFVAIGADAQRDGWLDHDTVIRSHDAVDPNVPLAGTDVVLQLYTPGTTGLPKGVMLTNDNFFAGLEPMARSWELTPESVNLAAMPMFHIGGSGWALFGLSQGCCTALVREVAPSQLLKEIAENRVNAAFLVPAVIQLMLATPGVESTDFSSLQVIAYGASPITETLLTKAMDVIGCQFVQLYGLTETTGAITQLDAGDHDVENRPHLLRSCGRPYPWVEVRIVDPNTGEDVPVGEIGELWTRSDRNMLGYWGNREATTNAITADGWFKTGDAGYCDAEGYLYLHDRLKDMIVSGGENVYPAEVENVLARHPDVVDVAVIGVPDEKWGEAVKAVVVRAEGSGLTNEELIAFARAELAGYKLPKSVDFAGSLPRNPSGKLLKREIRRPYWEGSEREIG